MSGTALEGLITEETQAPLETVAPAPSPEPAPSPAPEPVAAVTPAPVTEPPVQPVATPTQTADMVPLAVLLDERDKRRAAAAEAAQLRQWREQQERIRQEQREQFPNILDDPDGYHARMMEEITGIRREAQSQVQSAVIQERMANSEEKWQDKLGKEDWQKLNGWIKSSWDATTHQNAMKQRDPYGWAWSTLQGIERAERARQLEGELGGKDLATFLEEQRQKWLADQVSQAPVLDQQPSHPASQQPRAPDGKFASPSEPQRFEPVSLTAVPAASNSRNGNNKTGLTLTGLIDS